jgi:hypothetical protein
LSTPDYSIDGFQFSWLDVFFSSQSDRLLFTDVFPIRILRYPKNKKARAKKATGSLTNYTGL